MGDYVKTFLEEDPTNPWHPGEVADGYIPPPVVGVEPPDVIAIVDEPLDGYITYEIMHMRGPMNLLRVATAIRTVVSVADFASVELTASLGFAY